jgi:hypothetical protein
MSTERFSGLHTEVEPHLLNNGELADMCNLRTDTGALATRPGFTVEETAADPTLWPVALYSRAVVMPEVDGRRNLNGAVCTVSAWHSQQELQSGWAQWLEQPELLDGKVLPEWDSLASYPAMAQLGNRLFLGDGRHANLVVQEDGTLRPMGCPGQRAALTTTAYSGGGLNPQEDGEGTQYYCWGVQRVLKYGNLELASPVQTIGLTLEDGKTKCRIGNIQPFGFTPGDGWEVSLRILRSSAELTSTLTQIKVFDHEYFSAVGMTFYYDDDGSDPDPDLGVSYTLEQEPNYPFPPCRFLREWQGRLIGAGSVPSRCRFYSNSGSKQVGYPGIAVTAADVDAQLRVEGEAGYFVITAAVPASQYWMLDRPLTKSGMVDAVIEHVADVVYLSDALPDNIEGYSFGSEIYANQGSGNRITGLATAAGICYVLREHRVEAFDTPESGDSLTALADSPPGAVSAATIADLYSPRVFYYAGCGGVVSLTGGTAEIISDPVQAILESEVDHDYDEYTHGVYDPASRLYHLWLFQTGDVVEGALRCPSLLLTFDTVRNQWYRGELSASCSGIWKDEHGHAYAVIGTQGKVCRLDSGTGDGVLLEGLSVAENSESTLFFADAPFAGLDLTGFPVFLISPSGVVQRELIAAHGDSDLTVYGKWPTIRESGRTASVGSLRWSAESGEIDFAGASQGFEATKKLSRFIVVHEASSASAAVCFSEARTERSLSQPFSLAAPADGSAPELVLSGAGLGLRADASNWRIEGLGPAKILKIALEAVQTKR